MIQLQVINKILASKDASIITLNDLSVDYFQDYKEEFLFIKNHLDKYNCIPDIETFKVKFPQFKIINVLEPESYLLKELTEDRNYRCLSVTFNNIKDLLVANKVEEAMNLYKKQIDNLKTTTSLQCVDILKDTSRYQAYVDRTLNFSKYYVTTGFPELDNIIGGWDREEELATIVARTNYGKSWILLKSAEASARQGLNVGIYSGEMTERKVGYRIDTLISHISNGSLVHGNLSVMNDYKKYIDSLPTLYSGSIKVLTPQGINGPAGVSALRMFIEKEKLDILFVDQHSLLEDDRKAKSPTEKASNISKDLKNLQVMKRIPIITVSQQNRNSTENGVDTTLVAQSDRIGQDSTCVIFLEKNNDIMKLTLVKSRDSENGKILSYHVDLNTGTFVYIPTEDDLQNKNKEIIDNYESRYDVVKKVESTLSTNDNKINQHIVDDEVF